MKYATLRKIGKLYFGYEEVARVLGITSASARVACMRLVQRGLILRLKRNLYVLQEKWSAFGRDEKFILANLIQVPSYISLMTAMDYYELTTQVQRDFVESVTVYRTIEVEAQGTVFNYTRMDKRLYFSFSKQNGFFIATPEKAFLDALYLMSLGRYRFDITSIDFARLRPEPVKKLLKNFPRKTKKLWESYGYLKKT